MISSHFSLIFTLVHFDQKSDILSSFSPPAALYHYLPNGESPSMPWLSISDKTHKTQFIVNVSLTSPSMPWLSMPWCILSRNPSSCPSPRETHFITLSASCLLATDSSVKAGLQKLQCWFSWFFMPESRARLVGELSGRGDVLHVKSLTHLHVY